MSRILFFIASVVISVGLLLWAGGDLRFKKTVPIEPPVEELPRNFERGDREAKLILQQKLTDWTFKGFNRDVGQYDFYARGREIVPLAQKSAGDAESYLAKDLRMTLLSFRKEPNLVKKLSSTEIGASEGRITLDKNQRLVSAAFPGPATLEFRPEEGSQAQAIYVQTSDVVVSPLQDVPQGEPGTKLKIEARGKSRIKIGGSEIYGSGLSADTLQKRLIVHPPTEMYVTPEQLEPVFPKEQKKTAKQIFKVTSDGEVSMSEKSVSGEQALREITLQRNVVLTDGYSLLLCENLSLITGSDQKVSELYAQERVRLERAGVTCVAQSLVYKAEEKTILLTGAPDVAITDQTNEVFCNSAQVKDDSSYAQVKGNVKFRHKRLQATKEGKPQEEIVTLLCDSAEIWFSENEESKKMEITRALAHGSADKQISVESDGFQATGSELDCGFNKSGLCAVQVSGTDARPAQLSRGEQKVNAKTIHFDPQTETALFTDNVRAYLTSGVGEEKSIWNLNADRLQVRFEKNPQTGELTPDTIFAESKTRVQAKCLYKEREFQFETSVLEYNKKSGIILLAQGEKKDSKQTISEGENRLSASQVAFHIAENRLILFPRVEGKLSIPLPKGTKQTAQKPLFSGEWTVSCNRAELLFAPKEKGIAGLQAKGSVKLSKKDEDCEIECDSLSYDRTTSTVLLTGGRQNPVLRHRNNSITAKKITLQIDTNLASFREDAKFTSSADAPDKPSLTLTAKMISAKFAKETQGVQEVYAKEDVRAKITQPDATVTEITAEEAVYQAHDNTISVRGSPCLVIQPQVSIRENEIVYDIDKKVVLTKPGEKGYQWEIDPSGWRSGR